MLILFWASTAAIAWVYFGYPALLRVGAFGRRAPHIRESIQPLISIIVPARNEESTIESKLNNLMASDYPRERVEILVGSDGSTDSTEEIVRRFNCDGVELVPFRRQRGKSAIQNALVAASSGSVLVFTDSDCLFSRVTLQYLVQSFANPAVGLVTGRPAYLNKGQTSITENESTYLNYETWLREQESKRGLLAMASGSLFAVRRSLWQPIDPDLGDDFVLPLRMAKAGWRNVLERRAVAFTQLTQNDPVSMLNLKVRVISKDCRALLSHGCLLNPFRYGALAIGLWSHKLLRWLVPYFLLGALASSFRLSDLQGFRFCAGLQIAFYLAAIAGFLVHGRGRRFPWSFPTSFCLVNLAALLGTLKCLAGGMSGRWTPERKQTFIP